MPTNALCVLLGWSKWHGLVCSDFSEESKSSLDLDIHYGYLNIHYQILTFLL